MREPSAPVPGTGKRGKGQADRRQRLKHGASGPGRSSGRSRSARGGEAPAGEPEEHDMTPKMKAAAGGFDLTDPRGLRRGVRCGGPGRGLGPRPWLAVRAA